MSTLVEPSALTAPTGTVYTPPDQAATLSWDQSLDGGAVLAGFTLSLQKLFAEIKE